MASASAIEARLHNLRDRLAFVQGILDRSFSTNLEVTLPWTLKIRNELKEKISRLEAEAAKKA